jgi:hypothetical protein
MKRIHFNAHLISSRGVGEFMVGSPITYNNQILVYIMCLGDEMGDTHTHSKNVSNLIRRRCAGKDELLSSSY